MSPQEYIESGILESYAIGVLRSQERQEVECMSHIYPEIGEELRKIQKLIEDYSRPYAIQPPAELKNKIFARLATEKIPTAKADNTHEAKVVSMAPAATSGKPSNAFKWLAAACFIGLIGTSILYINERSTGQTLNNELQAYKSSVTDKQSTIDQLTQQNTFSQKELAMFRNPDFKTVFLKGTATKPQNSLAIVCCNPANGETVMAVENLPETPTDKQYQLWAIVNGTPVDMGVLPKDSVANGSFFKVKNVDGAQAFAITMEKAGGNPTPTLEEMYVMGAAI